MAVLLNVFSVPFKLYHFSQSRNVTGIGRSQVASVQVITVSVQVITASAQVITASVQVITASAQVITASAQVITADVQVIIARRWISFPRYLC
jgi:hypothetical protein